MTNAERNLVIECLLRERSAYMLSIFPGEHSKLQMIDDLIERFKAAKVSDEKPAPSPRITVSTKTTRNFAIIEARETINRIVEMCDEVGNYDSTDAQDFASSVQEKAESIGIWIDEHGDVTEKQQEALDNMESGISRWIR